MSYWDTSALVKLYVDETDSSRYREILAESTDEVHTSIITLAELYRTFWAKVADRALSSAGPDALMKTISEAAERHQIHFVPYDRELLSHFQRIVARCYSRPEPVRIRFSDGIHLASAHSVAAAQVVCADRRMRTAAVLVGLEVRPGTL